MSEVKNILHVIKKCEFCKNDFSGPPSTMARRKYCSKQCMSASKIVYLNCILCNKQFKIGKSHAKNRKYCSLQCIKKFLNVEKVCNCCNKKYTVPKCLEKSRFCSDSCRISWFKSAFKGNKSPQWLGGAINYYGPNWRTQKNKIRKLDGYQCQICGKTEKEAKKKMCIAHNIPFRSFGIKNYIKANKLNNLFCACTSCHMSFDRNNGTTGKPNKKLISVKLARTSVLLTIKQVNKWIDFNRRKRNPKFACCKCQSENICTKEFLRCLDCNSIEIRFSQI